jgi:hypothetical protein
MIPVETVLRKLIVEYEFVVLPGFGALLSHQVPVNYDKDSGIFSPPIKRLAFNEFLKLDDGLLANYISRHEQISHADAVIYVKRYTDRLWSVLQSRGEAKIAGIGQFSTNVEGKLVFDPNAEKHFRDEWYGFQKVEAKLVNKHFNSSTLIEHHRIEEEVEVIEHDAERSIGIKWWRWAAASILIGMIGYFSLFFVSGNLDNMSTLNPFTGLFNTRDEVNSKELKNNASEFKKEIPKVIEPQATSVVVSPDSSVEDSLASLTDTVAKVEAVVESKPVISKGKFFVIAGAFKGKRQAGVLLAQLKSKGFEDALLLPADQYNNRVKVAVKSYELETDAYAASKKLKDVIGELGWVYELK